MQLPDGQPNTDTIVHQDLHAGDQDCILKGVITGIGFIGAGGILKCSATTHGTATAASILDTGVIGFGFGFGFGYGFGYGYGYGYGFGFGYYDIGFLLALANFFILFGLGKLKPEDSRGNTKSNE